MRCCQWSINAVNILSFFWREPRAEATRYQLDEQYADEASIPAHIIARQVKGELQSSRWLCSTIEERRIVLF
jgi:quinol monooxygenase YgiN